MEVLYDEIHEENVDDPKALPQKLLALLNEGFVEEEQCVFLSLLKPSDRMRNGWTRTRTAM